MCSLLGLQNKMSKIYPSLFPNETWEKSLCFHDSDIQNVFSHCHTLILTWFEVFNRKDTSNSQTIAIT